MASIFVRGLGLAVLGAFLSCSAQITVNFKDDESGTVWSEVSLIPALASYWKDLGELDPHLPSDPLDPTLWRASAQKQRDLGDVKAVKTSARALTYSFTYRSLTAWTRAFAPNGGRPLFSVASRDGKRILTVYLDRKNLSGLLKMTVAGQSPASATLLPPEGTPTTRADYTEALVYLLEPYDPQVKTAVEAASLTLILNLPRPVISAPGGVVRGQTVTYALPLVDLLALEKPKEWTITY